MKSTYTLDCQKVLFNLRPMVNSFLINWTWTNHFQLTFIPKYLDGNKKVQKSTHSKGLHDYSRSPKTVYKVAINYFKRIIGIKRIVWPISEPKIGTWAKWPLITEKRNGFYRNIIHWKNIFVRKKALLNTIQ